MSDTHVIFFALVSNHWSTINSTKIYDFYCTLGCVSNCGFTLADAIVNVDLVRENKTEIYLCNPLSHFVNVGVHVSQSRATIIWSFRTTRRTQTYFSLFSTLHERNRGKYIHVSKLSFDIFYWRLTLTSLKKHSSQS